MRTLGMIALLSACYRDSPAPPPIATPHDPMIASTAMKCGPDDLAHATVDGDPGKRMRSHTSGSLAARGTGATWSWQGPDIPAFVPKTVDTLELFILDEVDGGWLAFYRDPYGRTSCGLGDARNCAYEAHHYDRGGQRRWSLRLDELMSRRDHLEIQDIRYAGGVLYFNEACQSYSSGAQGQCSSLVAVDPKQSRVLWRSPHLVSNGRFVIRGCYVVAGYGFTAERDNVFLLDRGSGRVLQKLPVSSAPEGYTLDDDNQLAVELYSGTVRHYRLRGFETSDARIEELDPPETMYGGAGYGAP
jgi:hypothetical protein